jgi:hypothetical protein
MTSNYSTCSKEFLKSLYSTNPPEPLGQEHSGLSTTPHPKNYESPPSRTLVLPIVKKFRRASRAFLSIPQLFCPISRDILHCIHTQ